MFGSKLKYFMGKSFRCILLFLFLGYYSSITFFTHSHIINGITIVHSHPFNSDKNGDTSKVPHNGKELVIIHLLSEFFTTFFVFSFAIRLFCDLLNRIPVLSTIDGYAEPGGYCTSPLRGPPSEMLFLI